MKGKYSFMWRVVIALVLACSLGLVTAVPVAADPDPATFNVYPFTLDDGVAWSTTTNHTGTHSVKLLADGDYVEFTPPAGTTLDDLSTITTGWSWWYHSNGIGPGLELRFAGPNFDTNFEHVDITVNTAELAPVGTQTWTNVPVTSTSTAECYGNDSAGTEFADSFAPGESWVVSPASNTLAQIVTIVTGYTGLADAGDWPLTRVRAEIYASGTVYIDDIEIAGTTYYGLFQDVIGVAAATGDTINVAAGTYSAETTWPIAVSKELTIQSVSGNATTIITPGAAGQGVIAITADNVTIDGFTITHGTESYTPSAPVENTIWVAAEYSTIKNNIITGAGGTAGIYIGGRTDPNDSYAQWLYATGKPLGHTIQDNAIDKSGSGEGWGIFAVELTDSLIHGNSFTGSSDVGDGRATPWNTTAGTPGTCIIIHSATAGSAAGSPGGGYVVVEDNTASWVKYTFLNFVAGVLIADVDGKFYEKAVAGTVDKVIVRNNTVSNVGKNSTDYSSGNIVTFSAESKVYSGSSIGASLTIGSNKVTIGPGNDFQTADSLIKIKNPKTANSTKYGVLDADNIVVKYNNFAGAESYGIYNGTTHTDQDLDSLGGDKVIVAQYNWWGTAAGAYHATTNPGVSGYRGDTVSDNVTYIPWLFKTTAANDGDTIANIVANEVPAYAKAVVLSSGWNTFSVPIGLDGQYNNWDELITLTSANYSLAYRFNPTTQEFESLATTDTDAIAPGEGFYIKMNEAGSIPYCYSTVVTIPSRALGDGWNFIGGGMTTRTEIVSCASIITAGGTAGYTHIISPAQNTQGSWVYIAGADSAKSFYAGEGYWVFLPIDRTLGLFDLTPVTWVP